MLIDGALDACAQNKSVAARKLGVHRKYVERRSEWPEPDADEA